MLTARYDTLAGQHAGGGGPGARGWWQALYHAAGELQRRGCTHVGLSVDAQKA
ncbi:MAG: hypothetical protein U0Z44_04895 [Kouleothrix sp.]